MTAKPEKRLGLDDLQQLHQNPQGIVDRLLDVLETLADPDEELRAWAADCLQEVESVPEPLAQRIAQQCTHENEVVANWACLTLGKAENVDSVQEKLAEALESHPSLGVKQSAAATLGEVTQASPRSKRALEIAAASSDPRLQRLAKSALQRFTS